MNKVIKQLRDQALQWHEDAIEQMRSPGRKTAIDRERIISQDYGFLMAAHWANAISAAEIEEMIDKIKLEGIKRMGSSHSENPRIATMDKQDVYEWFVEHWRYMAQEGTEDKHEFLSINHFDNIKNGCFLCEWSQSCSDCPVYWGNGLHCYSKGTPYDKWLKEGDVEQRKEYAAQVAALPMK